MKYLLLISLLFFLVKANLRNLASIDLKQIRTNILNRHNLYRKAHHVGNLARSSDLETIAQAYSKKLANTGVLQHSNNKYKGNYMGENLYMTTGSSVTGNDAVDLWYDEVKKYNFKKQGFSMETGHFTQLVWKNSKSLGCGVACKKGCFVTCNYYPAGNYENQYTQNVFPKK